MVDPAPAAKHYAVCILNPDGNSGVSGTVFMTQTEGEQVSIKAKVTGLTEGLHGFHIHQFGK